MSHKVEFDLIECAKGWQAECTIAGNWTCYSIVYPTIEQARQSAEKLAAKMGWSFSIDAGKEKA